jgi:glycosyltransferase involved in cell wall biosynthesis
MAVKTDVQNSRYNVAVIVPTIGNPLLKKAIHSILNQTYRVKEIIVVADIIGPLNLPEDSRIQVIYVGPRAGGNVARQAGIVHARSGIVALLDDDDEWLPEKIEMQLGAISNVKSVYEDVWLSSTRIVIKKPGRSEIIVPEKLFDEGSKLTHYLFKRTGITSTHGFIQSSAMMFPRAMALKVPFDGRLRFHQDIAWIVDISRRFNHVPFYQCREGLVIKNSIDASVSKTITAEKSIYWAKERLSNEPRILGDFILTQSLLFAKNSGSARNMMLTVVGGLKHGAPGFAAIAYSVLTTFKAIVTGRARF